MDKSIVRISLDFMAHGLNRGLGKKFKQNRLNGLYKIEALSNWGFNLIIRDFLLSNSLISE